MDFRSIAAMAQQRPSVPGLLAMLRGGDPQEGGGGGGGGGGVSEAVGVGPGAGPGAGAGSSGGGGGGRFGDYYGGPVPPPAPPPVDDQWGWGSDPASLITAPPEGWKSQTEAYDKLGMGDGWIYGNNQRENARALEHTQKGPQMPHGINPFTDIVYGAGSPGQEGQTSGFNYANPDGTAGPDLFGGKTFKAGNLPRDIPQSLQPWLAPALMRYFYQSGYHNQGGSGIKAPWTGAYAPSAPDIKTWPGITNYDPWGRSLGEIPNYSGG